MPDKATDEHAAAAGRGLRKGFTLGRDFAAETPAQARIRRDGFSRAAGDCLCTCGLEYRRHPCDPVDTHLTVLCNLDRVKL